MGGKTGAGKRRRVGGGATRRGGSRDDGAGSRREAEKVVLPAGGIDFSECEEDPETGQYQMYTYESTYTMYIIHICIIYVSCYMLIFIGILICTLYIYENIYL